MIIKFFQYLDNVTKLLDLSKVVKTIIKNTEDYILINHNKKIIMITNLLNHLH